MSRSVCEPPMNLALNRTVPKFLWSRSLLWGHRKNTSDLFTKCVNIAASKHPFPTCQAPATYGPEVGFLCFVDVVVQGGEVVARLHFVALTSDHVGSAHALARLRGAAGKEQRGSACSPLTKEPRRTRLCVCHYTLNGVQDPGGIFLLPLENKYLGKPCSVMNPKLCMTRPFTFTSPALSSLCSIHTPPRGFL